MRVQLPSRGWIAFTVAVLMLGGCGRQELVATPTLLVDQNPEHVFAACPTGCQAPAMDVLYATDRIPEITASGLNYGYGRDRRLSFGTATVALAPRPSWHDLIIESTLANRSQRYALEVTDRKQVGAFDSMLERLEPHNHGVRLTSAAISDYHVQQRNFHALLSERLAQSAEKDVYIFVHGFNNTFDDALFRAGQVWHFMGRTGVPLVYSWPAGYGGIRGYAYDRESGEFTVFHFKCFLQTVASCAGVERIHIVAHSRGCDVAVTGLRELNTLYRAAGKDPQTELKLENLVLAAPDLDEDVFLQRFVAENLLRVAKRTTIYTSTYDTAIEAADIVFASRRRIGRLGPRDFTPEVRQALAKLPNLQFVDCKVTHFSTSHDYVFAHPAALSDMILVLRDRRGPGVENGRPLLQPVEGVWELHNDYLAAKK